MSQSQCKWTKMCARNTFNKWIPLINDINMIMLHTHMFSCASSITTQLLRKKWQCNDMEKDKESRKCHQKKEGILDTQLSSKTTRRKLDQELTRKIKKLVLLVEFILAIISGLKGETVSLIAERKYSRHPSPYFCPLPL